MAGASKNEGDSNLKRLNWFLARSGGPSRRNADKQIAEGNVTVNGQVVREMGVLVDPYADDVRWNGRKMVLPEQTVVLALNKPTGYESTKKPRPKYPSVMELVPSDEYKGLVNVGRLDVDTSGLLLFTNDGELCNRLTAPRFEVEKTYEALVAGAFGKREAEILKSGELRLQLNSPHSYTAAPAKASILEKRAGETIVAITVHEGRYHEVRNMCKAVGHPVKTLKRISFGPIELGKLEVGQWRLIEGSQLDSLYSLLR